MTEVFLALLLFLALCYLGILFGRLAFVYTFERGTTQFCFVAIFALSTFMFSLVLLDASRIDRALFSANVSIHLLRLAFVIDLAVIAVFSPLCFFRSLVHTLSLRRYIALLIGCGLLLFFFGTWVPLFRSVFSLVGFAVPWDPSTTLWGSITTTIALFGVVAGGVLSGYAAVMTPFAFLRPLVLQRSGERAKVALSVLAKRQSHLLSLWVAKRRQIAEASRGAAASSSSSSSVLGSGPRVWRWVTKSLRSAVPGGAFRDRGDVARLRTESDGIRAVSTAVFLQMSEMDSLVRLAESGATWRGWAGALVGAVLLLHALVKLLFTVISLLRWSMSSVFAPASLREDTATRVVRLLETYGLAASHGGVREERIVWVSLVLNTWMILSSIRGFLLTVFRLVTTYTTFLSVDSIALGLTVGMGAYFLGQLLLLRPSPTLEYESVLSTVLQEHLPQSEMYFYLNDFVFVVSSVVTALVQRCIVSSDTTTLYSVAE